MRIGSTFFVLVASVFTFTLVAQAQAPAPKRFILVGVSGFGTAKANPDDLHSNALAPKAQPAGPWENLPTKDASEKIEDVLYLTHFAPQSQVDAIVHMFEKEGGGCREDLGLIIMSNSWGVTNAAKLAKQYQNHCARATEFLVVVDGVAKPIPNSYKKEIPAQKCLNMYQRVSRLKGGPLPGCDNHEQTYPDDHHSLAGTHVKMEWDGTKIGHEKILEFLAQP